MHLTSHQFNTPQHTSHHFNSLHFTANLDDFRHISIHSVALKLKQSAKEAGRKRDK